MSTCSNDYFHVYAKIDFLANRLFSPNTVTYVHRGECLNVCHVLIISFLDLTKCDIFSQLVSRRINYCVGVVMFVRAQGL